MNDCGTRVVEQNVEFAEAVDRGLEHALDMLVIRDIDGALFSGPAGGADVRGGALGAVAVQVGHEHGGAFTREGQRGRGANARAGTGDDGDQALETAHPAPTRRALSAPRRRGPRL